MGSAGQQPLAGAHQAEIEPLRLRRISRDADNNPPGPSRLLAGEV